MIYYKHLIGNDTTSIFSKILLTGKYNLLNQGNPMPFY